MTKRNDAWARWVPLIGRLRTYRSDDLRGDLSAGLITAVMLVPQGMAYAALAGMPPIYGLYAATLPLLVYGFLGTSRELAVGPVAVVALMVAASVGQLAEPGSEAFIGYAILLAAMVGALQLLMGLLRGGFLVNFLSHPVISGFTSAAAILIGTSQLGALLGIEGLPAARAVHEVLFAVVARLGEVHLVTLAIGLSSLVALVALRRWRRTFPAPLLVVALATALVAVLGLSENGVRIVGEVPAGLPSPALPVFDAEAFAILLPAAIAIALVGFMESISVAKAFARRRRYAIGPDQELFALGAANLAGSLFRGFPVTGGFSRTAVNAQAGARSGIASIVTAVAVGLVLVFFTPLFHHLPRAVLAAIILSAVAGLVDVREMRHLWKVKRSDLWLLAITFVGTLTLGIEIGLLTGIGASLLWFMVRSTRPHAAVLGRVPGTNAWRNLKNFPEAEPVAGALALRVDAELYFGNATFLKELLARLEAEAAEASRPIRVVALDMSAVGHLDSSADGALHEIADEYADRDVALLMANVKHPVRQVMDRSGLCEKIGRSRFFLDVDEAMDEARRLVVADQNGRPGARAGEPPRADPEGNGYAPVIMEARADARASSATTSTD
jgi:sulfate permease, SulP family